MYYLYAIFSMLSWGIAPVILKLYFSDVPIFVSLILILFFAGITSFFNKDILKIFASKNILFSCALVSFLTIIHYLGSFYGVLYGNIILTTLIIKNSPFFQSIIYSYINKKRLGYTHYIVSFFLIIGIILTNWQSNEKYDFHILYILLPLISAFAWSYLMIYLSSSKDRDYILSIGNLSSGILLAVGYLFYMSFDMSIFKTLSIFQLLLLLFLGLVPTYLAPKLWATSIEALKGKLIFLDYVTPIITIILSVVFFELSLSYLNIIGIGIILMSVSLYVRIQNKHEST